MQIENTSAPADTQEQRPALDIAQDLLECLEAEILQISEIRSILIAVWKDPEATENIKNLTGAGISASHFVSKGLGALAFAFKEELAALNPADEDSDAIGGAA